MSVIDKTVGTHTGYHLFLYQRMASVQQILGDGREMEAIWRKCVETAEKMYPQHKGTKPADVSKLFLWQNNLLKFYLDYNVD